MKIAEYINTNRPVRRYRALSAVVPRVICADGFSMSVQASAWTYCSPRVDSPTADIYNSMEVGFPSTTEPLLMEYAEDEDNPTETVYGWVPVKTIDEIIEKHGGIKS